RAPATTRRARSVSEGWTDPSLMLRALQNRCLHSRLLVSSYGQHTLRRSNMDRLKNKVAVITGGGSGIGRATCERFAEEGAAVVIAERDEASGRGVAERINQTGGRALFIATDVADEASVQRMVAVGERAFGTINILVNNAAIFILRGIEATPEE